MRRAVRRVNLRGMSVLSFGINARAEIVAVSDEWEEHVADGALPGAALIGRVLWDFFADSTTKELYARLVNNLSVGGSVSVPYRCDTASRRRWFEMTIARRAGERVEFTSRLLRQENRAPVALFQPAYARDERMVRMCSWCQRIAAPDGQWLSVDVAVTASRLLERETMPRITHGICPGCADGLALTISAQRKT